MKSGLELCGQEGVRLRAVAAADVPLIFEMQCDDESNRMAGTKPRTREVFFGRWVEVLADSRIRARMIECDGVAVGCITCFQTEGRDNVGYWISREHWGRGIASRALELFVAEEGRRPLRATSASANARSRRVLEKCGFRLVGVRMVEETDRFVRREIAEWILE